jgi:hypothetical protein
VTIRKYLVLSIVIVCAACGDVSLARGMKAFGAVTLANLPTLYTALLNPWVGLGILLLIGFFVSYLSALSWADLTYVLPATSLSYILMVLLASFSSTNTSPSGAGSASPSSSPESGSSPAVPRRLPARIATIASRRSMARLEL